MIVVDLDNNLAVYQSVANRTALTSLTRKRRDTVVLPVKFLRGGVVAELASGSTGTVGLKALGDFDGAFLASSTSWTKEGSATSTTYLFYLNLNTVALEALFTSDSVASLALALELSWVESARPQTVPGDVSFVVKNDYISGAEGAPTDVDAPLSFKLSSADGTQWEITITNDGQLTRTPLA